MASCTRAVGNSRRPTSTPKSAAVGAPAHHRALRAISAEECFDLLESIGVGRVGFTTGAGVVMLPVNFAVSGKTIIFRTAPDALLGVHANSRLSFEADLIDEALSEGWSVLVLGHARLVSDEREVQHLENTTHLQPWAPGARDVYVRITPAQISGRSIQPG